jgi:enoyl-CoA hydratase/carnithine racemase
MTIDMTAGQATVPRLQRDGDVFVLSLGDGENRFNPEHCAVLEEALSAVEATSAPRALVTVATGKFWSNGLDLEWIGAHPDELQGAVDRYHRLLAAFLGAGVPTVAAVQGHAFAAGAMFAMVHDHVVMRSDRGFWCVPEADLGMAFTPGMTALLQARLPRRAAREAMLTARRYSGPEALAAGIVDEAVPGEQVLERSIAFAATMATKHPGTLRKIKGRLYAAAIDALSVSQQL